VDGYSHNSQGVRRLRWPHAIYTQFEAQGDPPTVYLLSSVKGNRCIRSKSVSIKIGVQLVIYIAIGIFNTVLREKDSVGRSFVRLHFLGFLMGVLTENEKFNLMVFLAKFGIRLHSHDLL
jgi:hypothetical protein